MLIDVFHPQDPFAVMPEKRIEAIIEEAKKQEVQLVFFNESGIDLDQHTIVGVVWMEEEGRWEQGTFPFPKAVMNIRPWSPRKRSNRELIFRKLVPFIYFLIDDKWEITKMMAESPELSQYLVPTAILREVDQIDALFQTHDKIVLKPAQGSKGAGVQAVTRSGGQYFIQQGSEWIELDRTALSEWIREQPRDLLIQPYIVCLTPEGEPYDFRVLVQRDGNGQWQVSVIYPRIGSKGSITSNISINGRAEPLSPFLKRLFPESFESFPSILAELGLKISEFIDSHYAYPLNELGIDLAIDANRRIWFYEANTGPGTQSFEKERALLAVAYVKYVGEMASRGQVLTMNPLNARPTVGLLFSSMPSMEELEPYADVAQAYDVQLSFFLVDQISFRASSVSGYWREGREWVPKTFPVPDVVYNLTDQEVVKASHPLYRPKSNMPLTSSEPKGPIHSQLFFAIASRHPMLAKHLPDFVRPDHPKAVQSFMDKHRSVVMQPETAAATDEFIMIQRHPGHYVVQEGGYVHTFHETEMLRFWKVFQESTYILIQQVDSKTSDGYSLHIRVYLSRCPDRTWEVIQIVPLLTLNSPQAHPGQMLPLPVSWDWLLAREFSDEEADRLDAQARALACTMAKQLQSSNRKRLHELIIDMAIDRDRHLVLLGGEYEGPGDAVHPYEKARRLFPFALSQLQNVYERAVLRR